MATAQSIRDGIVLISWVTATNRNDGAATVNLTDVSQSCQLSYTIDSRNHTTIILALTKGTIIKYQEPSTIVATKHGVKQSMIFEDGKWKTTFPSARTCSCYYLVFDFVIDFIGKSMTLVKAESKFVLDHMLNLWKTKSLADVTFRFGKEEVHAHSLIIASASPVLAKMLKQQDFKESKEKVIEVKEVDLKVFENLLRFIYTGDAEMDNVDVCDLFSAADKYGMDSLKEECALHLAANLNIENAVQYLVKAHLHNSSNLYESTLNFMAKNSKAICSRKEWMEIIKKYPELCFAAMQLMILG